MAGFLAALDLPPEVRGGPDLAETPARVAQAWRDGLLDGYRRDPAEILREGFPTRSAGLVAVTGLDYHSICPHHLLPSRGLAHVAYLPGGRVVGFGQVARLVDALAHRLVLQEDLARAVADALVAHAGALGAACILEAEQACLTVRGERRTRALTHAQAFSGRMARDEGLQRRVLSAVARSRRPGGRPPVTAASAIVTGGGRGIGEAVARALTARGVRVTVFARTDGEVGAVVASGGAALAVAGDVSREADVARLLAAHEAALGPCDLLVNGAGILVRGAVDALAPEAWRASLEVNLTGAFLCARAVIPGMKARGRGRIVNVASISATLGTPGAAAYNASKWGLVGLTRCLAEELRSHGLQALSVSPGSTDTAMLRQTPFAPAMTPAEVAGVVVYAALDAPAAMTGADLQVYG